jgi:hypothetical protein
MSKIELTAEQQKHVEALHMQNELVGALEYIRGVVSGRAEAQSDLMAVAIAVRDACHSAWVTHTENWRGDIDLRSIVESRQPESSAGLSDALVKIDRAIKTVSQLCEGEIKWTMSIPVRPDSDPDIIIMGALHSARAAIAAHEAKRGAK